MTAVPAVVETLVEPVMSSVPATVSVTSLVMLWPYCEAAFTVNVVPVVTAADPVTVTTPVLLLIVTPVGAPTRDQVRVDVPETADVYVLVTLELPV